MQSVCSALWNVPVILGVPPQPRRLEPVSSSLLQSLTWADAPSSAFLGKEATYLTGDVCPPGPAVKGACVRVRVLAGTPSSLHTCSGSTPVSRVHTEIGKSEACPVPEPSSGLGSPPASGCLCWTFLSRVTQHFLAVSPVWASPSLALGTSWTPSVCRSVSLSLEVELFPFFLSGATTSQILESEKLKESQAPETQRKMHQDAS